MPDSKITGTVRPFVAASVVAIAFVAITIAIIQTDYQRQYERLNASYENLVVAHSSRLRGFIDTRIGLSSAMAELMGRKNVTAFQAFDALTAPFRLTFPEVQAINWVSPEKIIKWVTPLSGNEQALNLDLKKLDIPANTLRTVDQTGAAAATPTLKLAQGGFGFVVYQKVSSPVQHRGYINVVFRLERLLSGIVQEIGDAKFAISVMDGDTTLYSDPRIEANAAQVASSNLEVAGRSWAVALYRLDGQHLDQLHEINKTYLLMGLFGSVLVGILIYFLAKRRQDLASSARRFQRYATLNSDWFWETDSDLRFNFLSENFANVTGVDPGGLIGKTRRQVGAPGARPEALEKLLEKMEAHEPFYGFVHYRDHPTRGRVFLSISGEPVYEEGEFIGYQGIGKDITIDYNREIDLRTAKEHAERASMAKSEFLAHMSHELRTPLNAILGFSQMISNEVFGPIASAKYREYSHDIESAGRHLLSIVDDVLDLSKVEAGQIRAEIKPIEVKALVEEAVKISESRAKLSKPRIQTRFPESGSTILADGKLSRQVLINVLSNALKFSPPETDIQLSVSEYAHSEVTIAISDSGPGIAPEDLDLVLEPFGQARGNVELSHEGTGLGLPLSVQLMKAQNGRLEIQSEEGRGTTVTLTFQSDARM